MCACGAGAAQQPDLGQTRSERQDLQARGSTTHSFYHYPPVCVWWCVSARSSKLSPHNRLFDRTCRGTSDRKCWPPRSRSTSWKGTLTSCSTFSSSIRRCARMKLCECRHGAMGLGLSSSLWWALGECRWSCPGGPDESRPRPSSSPSFSRPSRPNNSQLQSKTHLQLDR